MAGRSALVLGFISRNHASSQVFTFADQMHPMLCHLAHSVEMAGGLLHLMGLQHGHKEVPFLNRHNGEEEHLWHFEDKSVMLKKHLFFYRAIERLPANATVVFVDAFDVLFQRPLEELTHKYHELAEGHLKEHGHWPVIFGGDLNCWPFPHNARLRVSHRDGTNRSWLHRIPPDAALSTAYHGTWRYPGRKGEIAGNEFCQEWLAEHSHASEAPEKRPPRGLKRPAKKPKRRHFPFVCSGTFIGTVSSVRRLLHKMFGLSQRTAEYDDQALVSLLLLRFPYLGFVDKEAQLFLGLHGHDDIWDLERPLCRGRYFARTGSAKPSFQAFSAPRLLGSFDGAPKLLHFNGNGKRHMWRCVKEFHKLGLLGENDMKCDFFDVDRAQNASIYIRLANVTRGQHLPSPAVKK